MPATTRIGPTGDPHVDGVLGGVTWAVGNLTYSFPAQASFYGSSYGSGEPGTGFGVLNGAQQAAARAAFSQFAAVTGLSFTEITETSSRHADLRLASSDKPSTAWAYLPSTAAEGGDAWFNKSSGAYATPAKGNYAFATFVHEIGHALGLEHAHERYVMPIDRDSMEYTVMSYRSYIGALTTTGYTNEKWGYAQSLMMYDIAALQHMYGANYTTNSGDTTYSWSPATGELFINGASQGAPGGNRIFQTVWDGGGTDTYDFSSYSTSLTIDLRPGEWIITSSEQLARLHYNGSQVAVGNIANALLHNNDVRSLIENVIGGAGDDTIIGNLAANRLAGGAAVFSWGANGAANGFGDFNGDGRADVLQIETSGAASVWLSEGSELSAHARWGSGTRPGDKMGDFNGDGRDDIVQLYENGNAYVWTSTGTGFSNYGFWGTGVRPTDQIGDFDGDGKADVIQLYENGNAYVWLSNGSGFNPYSMWGAGVRPTDQIGDFNGDGKADVIQLYENGNAYVWLSNGSGFDSYTVWGSGVRPTDKIGDFNGDGQDDVIQLYENGYAYVWTSNGAGFDAYSAWGWGVRPSDQIGDFNGDGRDDIVQLHENGNAYVWLSTGSGFQNYSVWASDIRPTDRFADVNGDGRDDIIRLDDSGNAFVWISSGTDFGSKTAWGSGFRAGQASGNDTFVFHPGFGHDTIIDFEAGTAGGDVIQFDRQIFADFDSVMANTRDEGGNVLISYDADNTVTLLNLSTAQLHSADFSFA